MIISVKVALTKLSTRSGKVPSILHEFNPINERQLFINIVYFRLVLIINVVICFLVSPD